MLDYTIMLCACLESELVQEYQKQIAKYNLKHISKNNYQNRRVLRSYCFLLINNIWISMVRIFFLINEGTS